MVGISHATDFIAASVIKEQNCYQIYSHLTRFKPEFVLLVPLHGTTLTFHQFVNWCIRIVKVVKQKIR